ncbi:anthranilate synthase component I [Amycolatopsis regifaucium]|uniref:Anthranilate synthase component 1 n=1 Tax=Amycolatopsis regifaucium TaxID=546365 RepID=A0A154MMX6_9PSEU|nr:anthranilate synthase component I [Amycolatopsis regifaucium]KZB85708.1 anthranilate synthase [Amycolatopsis regifaucium]OKA10537.1 anthranilate synthase component I [Amycolatopsis regifaucium]
MVSAAHASPSGLGSVSPSRDEFRALAEGRRVIPVVRRVLADGETPIGVYRKLAADRPGTFLFESAENGASWSRWSFIGVDSPAALTVRDGEAVWTGTPPVGLPTEGDPLTVLRETVATLHTEQLPGMPPLTGGMVGYIGYDAVRWLERLPELAERDLDIPELTMLLATDLAAFDHHEGTVTLIANAVNWDDSPERVDAAYDDAVARLNAMTKQLHVAAPATAAVFDRPAPDFTRRRAKPDFHAAVDKAVEAIKAGEAFQIVPSQRFEIETQADALDVYRVLRTSNPSPYMYLLRLDGFDIVGSSPESLVTVRDGRATTHPIAGTRWRGADPEEDAQLAKDLLADEKERAEHLMLVDLGRNDLGKVCKPGTVRVVDFFDVERYSHVMHIVSTVTGELLDDKTAFDAVAACFPAGTLSGAPKVRAMQLIEELEPTRRALYGGVVGYLDFAGDADTAIAIRTALMKDGVAYVQAGGGVVADSVADYEDNESLNKARTVLSAVAAAQTMIAADELDPVGDRTRV